MFVPLFPELLAAARGGDEQAFAALWRDLQPAVLRYFRVAQPANVLVVVGTNDDCLMSAVVSTRNWPISSRRRASALA